MKTLKVILGVIVVLLVVIVLVLNIFGRTIIKTGVETAGPKLMGVPVTLEDVDFALLRGNAKLKGLVIGNPEGFKTDYVFKLGEVVVDMESASVLSDTVVINEILIDGPGIIYEMGLAGSNIGKLMENLESGAGEGTAEQKPAEEEPADKPAKNVLISNLIVRNGSISVSAKILGGHALKLPLPTIHLKDIGKEEEGASLPEVITKVLRAVMMAVVNTVSSSGRLLGDVVKAASGAALKGADVAGDLAGQGLQAAGKLTSGAAGAAAGIAGKGLSATANVTGKAGALAGKGVGAAGGAVGKGAGKIKGGISGLFKRKKDEKPAETPAGGE